jgi:hypothetical protein
VVVAAAGRGDARAAVEPRLPVADRVVVGGRRGQRRLVEPRDVPDLDRLGRDLEAVLPVDVVGELGRALSRGG